MGDPEAREWQRKIQQLQKDLIKIGWPLTYNGTLDAPTKEALTDFQKGFAYNVLYASGKPDQETLDAVKYSLLHGGKASRYFTFKQFKSNGNGWIKVNRALIIGLEALKKAGGNVTIISGYRDPAYNESINSGPNSMHVFGAAADIPHASGGLTVNQVKALRVFSGIGWDRSTNRVRHVDVRHTTGNRNLNGSTVRNPSVWDYA